MKLRERLATRIRNPMASALRVLRTDKLEAIAEHVSEKLQPALFRAVREELHRRKSK